MGVEVEAPMVVVAVGVMRTWPVCWKTALPVPATVKRFGEVVVPTESRLMVVVPVKPMLPEVSMANLAVTPCFKVKALVVANC